MEAVRSTAREAFQYLVFWAAYAYFAVGGVLLTLASAVLYRLLPRGVGARLGKGTIGLLFRSYLAMLQSLGLLKLELKALDSLRTEGSLLIAPNHPCLLDAVLVISRIPDVGCIMKAAIWDNPILGGGARLAGYIRNNSTYSMIRLAADELRAGHNLLVFPEGTRTRTQPVNRFKGGFALIAKRAGAAIQTVFIETDSPFLGKTWPLLKKPRFPIVYHARLGRRFTVQGDVQRFLAGLEDYYRQELGQRPAGTTSPASTAQPAAVQRSSA